MEYSKDFPGKSWKPEAESTPEQARNFADAPVSAARRAELARCRAEGHEPLDLAHPDHPFPERVQEALARMVVCRRCGTIVDRVTAGDPWYHDG